MAAIQTLKKQLRGIRSTQKLTKAMKTVSTVKFSKLNGMYGGYAPYGDHCRRLMAQYGARLCKAMGSFQEDAPELVVILGSNKGLCGSFNAEVFRYAAQVLAEKPNAWVAAVGKKTVSYCDYKQIPVVLKESLNDLPTYEESGALFDRLLALRQTGKVSRITVVYPRYKNMMVQTPSSCELFDGKDGEETDIALFVPDEETVVATVAQTAFRAMFYDLVLQTALGAQAATLMTMRSAYDTATGYCAELEGQINRQRQSAVTADVLETSVER